MKPVGVDRPSRLRFCFLLFPIAILSAALFVPPSVAASPGSVALASVSLGSPSSDGRSSVFVTLRNGGSMKVRGTIRVRVPMSGGAQTLTKRFKLKPHETKEFKAGRARRATGTPRVSISVTSATHAQDDVGRSGGDDASKGLNGTWSGTYASPGGSQGVSASVRQNGGTLTIVTSKSGPGHRMTGSIRGGRLNLKDPVGGQTWTGSVSGNRIVVRDLLTNMSPPGMQTITLHR